MSRQGGEVGVLSLGEALARLDSPFATEELATLTGSGALVVDLPAALPAAISAATLERLPRLLGQLACPTIAIRSTAPSTPIAELAARFDLLVASAGELELLLAAIRANPQASLALVQLLRLNAQLGVHEGLIAESLVYSVLQAGPEFAAWRRGRSRREPAAESAPALLVERSGDRLSLSLNRPLRHNAFSLALRDALVEGLQLAACDASIREVLLRGEGPSFCSGGDLDEFGSFPDPATAHAIRSTRNPSRLLASLSARSRARVHGACIGAGVELPAFTAHVSAVEGAFFQLPEVAMGLVPGAGGTVSLLRRIGRQRTAELAISGRRLDLETALAWGLIDEVVPAA